MILLVRFLIQRGRSLILENDKLSFSIVIDMMRK